MAASSPVSLGCPENFRMIRKSVKPKSIINKTLCEDVWLTTEVLALSAFVTCPNLWPHWIIKIMTIKGNFSFELIDTVWNRSLECRTGIPKFADIEAIYIDGLVQERCNSIAYTLELHLFCIKTSILSNIWSLRFISFPVIWSQILEYGSSTI